MCIFSLDEMPRHSEWDCSILSCLIIRGPHDSIDWTNIRNCDKQCVWSVWFRHVSIYLRKISISSNWHWEKIRRNCCSWIFIVNWKSLLGSSQTSKWYLVGILGFWLISWLRMFVRKNKCSVLIGRTHKIIIAFFSYCWRQETKRDEKFVKRLPIVHFVFKYFYFVAIVVYTVCLIWHTCFSPNNCLSNS